MINSSSEDLHASFAGGEYRDYPIPSEVRLVACIQGVDFQEQECHSSGSRVASVEFELPISNPLFVLSRGPSSVGTIKATSSPKQPPGTANIKVTVVYDNENRLNQARVLLLSRGQCSQGFGVFTPSPSVNPLQRSGTDKTFFFDIAITFPEGTEDRPIRIPMFHSDAHGMNLLFNVSSTVVFAIIRLMSSVSRPISVTSLRVERGVIATAYAPIRARFECTASLQIRTTNAPIFIEATLHSDNWDTVLTTRTTNANLSACIRATSATRKSGFGIHTLTSNGRIDVDLQEAPASSVVHLEAVTRDGPAMVSLPATFKGKLLAVTTPPSLATIQSTNGKKIHLKTTESPDENRAEGRVGWLMYRRKANIGMANVRATNSSATLHLR